MKTIDREAERLHACQVVCSLNLTEEMNLL